MFYRVNKKNQIIDYADYEYSDNCLYTEVCTGNEFRSYQDNFIIENGKVIRKSDFNEYFIEKRKTNFEKDFFNTSLGWIRRKVTMKNGDEKDFLSDLLIPIMTGLELEQDVEILTYKTPDFTKEFTLKYLESLQEVKSVTPDFIIDCLNQTVKDFGLNKGGCDGV